MSAITVRLSDRMPKVTPLHGVNNGPVGYGGLVNVSHYYKEAAFPWVRLHDPNWPHPREVDIPQIFPDFDADSEDPNHYCFNQTDSYLQMILNTGARIVYRLGVSIEHTPHKYFTTPPRDFQKWADICTHLIRHCNDGWADGFRYGITHWEIWNEPDIGPSMWDGSFEQYLELYRTASLAIKSYNPLLKVGGYAAAGAESEKTRQFLSFCRNEKLPLDFFSWHSYTNNPSQIAHTARTMRSWLDEFGFAQTESHLNEWNLMDADWGRIWNPGEESYRRSMFERQKGAEGASFVAAVLTLMQDASVDVANYYDGQPSALFCGLFDYYGMPQKSWYAMKAFSELLKYPFRAAVELKADPEKLFALACCDPDLPGAAILLSNYACSENSCLIQIEGLWTQRKLRCTVRRIDSNATMEVMEQAQFNSSTERLRIELPMHSVTLVTIE